MLYYVNSLLNTAINKELAVNVSAIRTMLHFGQSSNTVLPLDQNL